MFFLLPMVMSLYFSLTVWDFSSFRFVGLENFRVFFSERTLSVSVRNTLVYAVLTSGLKVVLAFFIALFLNSKIKSKGFLRSVIFFPNLVSTIAVGITFRALMHPSKGLFNTVLGFFGLPNVDWLGNPDIALLSIIATDVWRGVGVATVIYIAGLQAIDRSYYEAASIDGASKWQQVRTITLPLVRPAMNSVIILSFVSGMRCFDLIWAMTSGVPTAATNVIASAIYNQYAAGFYGLSTAGNVVMLVLISVIAFPLQKFLISREVD
ncbi:sugar ABC transporter permease [Ruminococcaceae bacterium OttesenSCG-928-D13]|nr:sugar ABC transporter permease [Ruminococcaceae bacterium OttesenSCG-928-D13]